VFFANQSPDAALGPRNQPFPFVQIEYLEDLALRFFEKGLQLFNGLTAFPVLQPVHNAGFEINHGLGMYFRKT
jgi:hypothetical protein